MAPEPSRPGTYILTMYMRHATCTLVVLGLVGGFAALRWCLEHLAALCAGAHLVLRDVAGALRASAIGRDPPRGSNQADLFPLAVEFCRCC